MKRSSLLICLIILLVMAGIPIVSATEVTGVSPGSGTNDGSFKLTISGSGFNNVTQVQLNKCKLKTGGSSEPPFSATSYSVSSPSRIVATFNLNGKAVGDYDVRVNAPKEGFGAEDWGIGSGIFHIYASGSAPTATKTAKPGSTATETYATPSAGENSVFFETSPSGATIFLDGTEIGTSTFTYYTDYDGAHRVVAKKLGYEDYEELITIVEGRRTYFRGELVPLSSTSGTGTPSATVSGKPGKTVTTIKKSTLQMPTPLGTFEAPVEESPAGPATVLWALALGIALLVLRRR